MSAQLELDYEAALNKALKALARRARSKREMRTLLSRAGFRDEDVQAVEDRLVELHLLDDRAFACEVVESYGKGRGESTQALRHRLSFEEIPSEQVEAAISEVLGEEIDLERALGLGVRRARAYRKLQPDIAARRLTSFLAQKGYDSEIVRDVCRQVLSFEEAEFGP